jgi:L-rhamnose mutarotase
MQGVAFQMKLYKGKEEYKKRHDVSWPELENFIEKTGS